MWGELSFRSPACVCVFVFLFAEERMWVCNWDLNIVCVVTEKKVAELTNPIYVSIETEIVYN